MNLDGTINIIKTNLRNINVEDTPAVNKLLNEVTQLFNGVKNVQLTSQQAKDINELGAKMIGISKINQTIEAETQRVRAMIEARQEAAVLAMAFGGQQQEVDHFGFGQSILGALLGRRGILVLN